MIGLVVKLGIQGSVVAVGILGFFFVFTRSSKKWPTSWKELRSELAWQILGARALTEDIVLRPWNNITLYSQSGRVAVITGGNRGLGLYIVDKLLKCDFVVIMGVRNPKEAEHNVQKVLGGNPNNNKIIYEKLDVGSMSSVQQFAKKIQDKYAKIDLLINNAGIMAAPFSITDDGFESQLAINYLGHFLLSHLLYPQLKAAGTNAQNARIVNVSSCVHVMGEINFDDINGNKYYYPADAYNQSKLAQVLFTRHLQKIIDANGDNIQTHAVHPGVVDTDLFVHSSTTYIPWFKKLMFKNPEEGSRTVVHAAISPKIEGKGGSYMSNCRLAKMHSKAKDAAYCERFFKFTCDLLKLKEFGKTA